MCHGSAGQGVPNPRRNENCYSDREYRIISWQEKMHNIFLSQKFFCGYDRECSNFGSKWALATAKENVEKHFPVVGIAEKEIETAAVLEKVLPVFFDKISATLPSIPTGDNFMTFLKQELFRKECFRSRNAQAKGETFTFQGGHREDEDDPENRVRVLRVSRPQTKHSIRQTVIRTISISNVSSFSRYKKVS